MTLCSTARQSLLLLALLAPKPSLATPTPAKLDAAVAALEASDYATAERDFSASAVGPGRGAALLGLARVQLATGRYGEAARSSAGAAQADRNVAIEAACVRADALTRLGKSAEAISLLESIDKDPRAKRARLLLGELFIATGRRADARDPLMTLVADYNRNAIQSGDAEALALVGRAAHLLRSARDANDAYDQSERSGKHRVETLLFRADLFLDKYDPGHAEEVVKEALETAPHDARARVAMARVKLDQALDFEAAEAEIAKALATDPKLAEAFFVRAGLALRTMDLAAADAALDLGLAVNPSNLDLLSMKAAVRFLGDDRAGFERIKRSVFSANREFSRFFEIVGEFAEWEHRYDEIVAMMRDATKIDADDSKAWADLGLNLIRAGDEREGVSALRQAWDKDHFNVRVFNTLNLFEKDIANNYETVDSRPFRIRYHKEERPILSRYVPALLGEAWETLTKRYGYVPKVPVTIELYARREDFGVRTSGLPNVGIQGVCFGRTLAAMSPRAEPFNWGNVLWHELAHVFAIQLSNSRVPRWFTEGLSEYDTFSRRPEWQREEDPPLYVALRAGRIPPIEQLNRTFTHAESPQDVTMAYYAASQLQVYLASEFGVGKVTRMLRLWGEGKRTPEVIEQSLGVSSSDLDERFRRWLAGRLGRYDRQFVPDDHAPALSIARLRADKAPQDPRAHVELALALVRERKLDAAHAAIKDALALNPVEPDAHFLQARLWSKNREHERARRELSDMVRMGSDGYGVRMLLADLATSGGDTAAARENFRIAHEFDPTMAEPLQSLYDIDHLAKRDAAALDWLRKLVRIDQHDRKAHRLLLEELLARKEYTEARSAGEAALFVDVENHRIHSMYAAALSHTGDHARAIFELESAVLCSPPPADAAKIHVRLAEEHIAVGNRAKARAEAAEALRIDPNDADAKALKSL
jgi:cellulose synthase operon protein C